MFLTCIALWATHYQGNRKCASIRITGPLRNAATTSVSQRMVVISVPDATTGKQIFAFPVVGIIWFS